MKPGKPVTMWAVVGFDCKQPHVYKDSISYTRSEAIKKHTKGWSVSWNTLKRKYNHRAVKIELTAKIINP